MPTYVYRCKSCNYEFEEFQSITAEPLIVCPKCAKSSLKRLLTPGGGLVFKGNGFYLTDYKKAGTSSNSSFSSGDSKSDGKAGESKAQKAKAN